MSNQNKNTSIIPGVIIMVLFVLVILACISMIVENIQKNHYKVWCRENRVHAENYFKNCRSGDGQMVECVKLERIFDDYKKFCVDFSPP